MHTLHEVRQTMKTHDRIQRNAKKREKTAAYSIFISLFLIWHFSLVISPRGDIVARVSCATRSTDPQLFKTPRQRPQKYLSTRAMLSQTSFTRRYFPLQFRNHTHTRTNTRALAIRIKIRRLIPSERKMVKIPDLRFTKRPCFDVII